MNAFQRRGRAAIAFAVLAAAAAAVGLATTVVTGQCRVDGDVSTKAGGLHKWPRLRAKRHRRESRVITCYPSPSVASLATEPKW
jgi:hypothetical protein